MALAENGATWWRKESLCGGRATVQGAGGGGEEEGQGMAGGQAAEMDWGQKLLWILNSGNVDLSVVHLWLLRVF